MKPNKEEQFFCLEVKGLTKSLMSKVIAGAVAFSLVLTPSLPFAFAGNTTQPIQNNQIVNTGTKSVQSPAQQLAAKMKEMLALLTKVVTIGPRTITTTGFRLKASKDQPGTVTLNFVLDACNQYTGRRCASLPKNLQVVIEIAGSPSKPPKTTTVPIEQTLFNGNPPAVIKKTIRPGDTLNFQIGWPMVTLKDASEIPTLYSGPQKLDQ